MRALLISTSITKIEHLVNVIGWSLHTLIASLVLLMPEGFTIISLSFKVLFYSKVPLDY
jgi:hypothetical protein